MKESTRNWYYRAIGIAEYIIEGHNITQTQEEFGVSRDTISKSLDCLRTFGSFGKELNRNQLLYVKAKQQLGKNRSSKKSS